MQLGLPITALYEINNEQEVALITSPLSETSLPDINPTWSVNGNVWHKE
jgi:hypothetical protein